MPHDPKQQLAALNAGGKPGDVPVFMPTPTDSREPDYSRKGIFVHHNCSRCSDGARPCVRGSSSRCEYPHARND